MAQNMDITKDDVSERHNRLRPICKTKGNKQYCYVKLFVL